jgi:hypothetical protein
MMVKTAATAKMVNVVFRVTKVNEGHRGSVVKLV